MRTLDELAAELQPSVNRLLGEGLVKAAADLVYTYREEAEMALLKERLDAMQAAAEEQAAAETEVVETEVVDVEDEVEEPAGEKGAPELRGLDVLIPPKEDEK